MKHKELIKLTSINSSLTFQHKYNIGHYVLNALNCCLNIKFNSKLFLSKGKKLLALFLNNFLILITDKYCDFYCNS